MGEGTRSPAPGAEHLARTFRQEQARRRSSARLLSAGALQSLDVTILGDAFASIDIEFLARVASYVKPEVLFGELCLEQLQARFPDARTGGTYPPGSDGRPGRADLSIGPDVRWELKSSYGFDHRNAARESWLIKNEIAKDIARVQAFAHDGRTGTFGWLVFLRRSKYGLCSDTPDECMTKWTEVIAARYGPPIVHRRGPFALFELTFS